MDIAESQAEHNRGFHLHLHNRIAEAEPFYRRAIALDPDFKEAWMNLGLAMLLQGRPDEALSCQREALRVDPDRPMRRTIWGWSITTKVISRKRKIVSARHCASALIMPMPR
jgi:tetratricopeptide (TPR) repeat protein